MMLEAVFSFQRQRLASSYLIIIYYHPRLQRGCRIYFQYKSYHYSRILNAVLKSPRYKRGLAG